MRSFTVVNYKAQRATRGHDRTRKILSRYLVVQVSRGLGQGYTTIDGRTRAEIHFSSLQIQPPFPSTTPCHIQKQFLSRVGLSGAIKTLYLVSCSLGVEGADFYFMCALETLWWGSVCLTIGGVFIVTMLSSYEESFYSEPESCLVYCHGCRQEGTCCVASEQTLAAL